MRWISILLTLVMVITGVLWFYTPDIAKWVLQEELTSRDFHVQDFQLERLSTSGLHLKRIEIHSPVPDAIEPDAVSPELVFTVEGADFRPLPEGEFDLQINELTLTMSEVANKPDSNSATTSLTDLLDEYSPYLLLAPLHGSIQKLSYCDIQCSSFSISWVRQGGEVMVQLTHQQGQALVFITPSNLKAEIIGTDSPMGYADISAVVQNDLLQVVANELVVHQSGDLKFEVNSATLSANDPTLSLEATATLPLSVNADEAIQQIRSAGTFNIRSNWKGTYESDPVISVSPQNQDITAAFSLQDELLDLTITDPLEGTIHSTGIPEIYTTFLTGTSCQLSLENYAPSCQFGIEVISEYEGYEIKLGSRRLEAVLENELPVMFGQFDVAVSEPDNQLLTALINLKVENNSAALNCISCQIMALNFSLETTYDIESGHGRASLSSQNPVKNLETVLDYLAIADVNLASGQLKLSGSYSFEQGQFKQETTVVVEDASLTYAGYSFDNLRMGNIFSGWPIITNGTPVELTIDKVNVGVPLEALSAVFNAELNPEKNLYQLQGSKFQFDVLGGQVVSESFDFEAGALNGQMLVQIDNLSLAELLSLQPQEINGSGMLSGSVPVQINHGNLSVENAEIKALAPGGFIAYQPDASVNTLGQQNQGLNIVLAAMNNFNYHSLEAALDYQADGVMVAKTSIKGSNPNYQNGREVHLNLTLEENINTLLESLRLGSDIADKVGKKTAEGVH